MKSLHNPIAYYIWYKTMIISSQPSPRMSYNRLIHSSDHQLSSGSSSVMTSVAINWFYASSTFILKIKVQN